MTKVSSCVQGAVYQEVTGHYPSVNENYKLLHSSVNEKIVFMRITSPTRIHSCSSINLPCLLTYKHFYGYMYIHRKKSKRESMNRSILVMIKVSVCETREDAPKRLTVSGLAFFLARTELMASFLRSLLSRGLVRKSFSWGSVFKRPCSKGNEVYEIWAWLSQSISKNT